MGWSPICRDVTNSLRASYQNRGTFNTYHSMTAKKVLKIGLRTLCVHLGLLLGVGGQMQELRRNRSGIQVASVLVKLKRA